MQGGSWAHFRKSFALQGFRCRHGWIQIVSVPQSFLSICKYVDDDSFYAENMSETLCTEALESDHLDTTGLHKALALALVKAVMYSKDSSEEYALVTTEVLATIQLYVPYSSDFNEQLHQVILTALPTTWVS